jgi:hypothetical protein
LRKSGEQKENEGFRGKNEKQKENAVLISTLSLSALKTETAKKQLLFGGLWRQLDKS